MEQASPTGRETVAGRAAPAAVIVVALAAAACTGVFFLLFTLPGRDPPSPAPGAGSDAAETAAGGTRAIPDPDAAAVPAVAAPEVGTQAASEDSADDEVGEGNGETAVPAEASAPWTWPSPVEAARWVADRLAAGDVAAVADRLDKASPGSSVPAELAEAFDTGRAALAPEGGAREIGRLGSTTRWVFPLAAGPDGGDPAQGPSPAAAMELDLLAGAGAGRGFALAAVRSTAPQEVASDGDSLAVADRFLAAVLAGDRGAAARLAIADRLPASESAALSERLRDGGWGPAPRRPLVATIVDEGLAWVIARIVPEDDPEAAPSEIGLELARTPPGAPWRVVDVRLPRTLEEGPDPEAAAAAETANP